jgi:DNA-binding Lrp family transcriptional regulator
MRQEAPPENMPHLQGSGGPFRVASFRDVRDEDKALVKEMDAIDRRCSPSSRRIFHLAERPFEAIGAKVGLTEEETRKRVVKSLKDRGYIGHRTGVDAGKQGYTSILCGVRCPFGETEDVSGAVRREAGCDPQLRTR